MNQPIVALTLHQPWATLVAIGAKTFETRSWGTVYRGPLIIHAGKLKEAIGNMENALALPMTVDGEAYTICLAIRNALRTERLLLSNLTLGCAVALVDLVDCIKMTPDFIVAQSANELLFGLWEPGRYAWKLANVRPFEKPVAARGAQGLWKWSAPLPEVQP